MGPQHRLPVIQVVCPVCKAPSVNFKQFVRHLWARHLFVDESDSSTFWSGEIH
jgi:hypothetical protein